MTCHGKSTYATYPRVFQKVYVFCITFVNCQIFVFKILFCKSFLHFYILYDAHLYSSLSTSTPSATKPLCNLQKQNSPSSLQKQDLRQVCKNKIFIKSSNHFKSVNLIEYSIRDGLHLKPMFHLNHSFPLISLVSDHSLSSCITNHHYKPFS